MSAGLLGPKRDGCRFTDSSLDERDRQENFDPHTLPTPSPGPWNVPPRAIGQQVLHAGPPPNGPQAKARLDINEVRAVQRLTQIAVIEDEYMARDVERPPIFLENPPVETIGVRGLAHQNAAGLEEAVGAMKCGHGVEHMLDDMPHADEIKTPVGEIRIYQLPAMHVQARLFGVFRSRG